MSNITLNKPLRIMGIDIGSKYSAIFFNDYLTIPFKDGKNTLCLKSENYKEHISFLCNWIRRLKPNLVIYERKLSGTEEFEDRKHSWNTWKIFRTVIGYCQESKIEGIPVSPGELKNYRSQQNYMYINEANWIKYKGLTCKIDELPKSWKEEAEKEGFVWIGEEACNELDAQCLWEYWNYFDWHGDKKWIEGRKKLHWQQLKNEPRPIVDKSKPDRRWNDNWYLNGKNIDSQKVNENIIPSQNKLSQEDFKDGQRFNTPLQSTKTKTRVECNDCKRIFLREPKYISKTRPNCCYDCIQKRKRSIKDNSFTKKGIKQTLPQKKETKWE